VGSDTLSLVLDYQPDQGTVVLPSASLSITLGSDATFKPTVNNSTGTAITDSSLFVTYQEEGGSIQGKQSVGKAISISNLTVGTHVFDLTFGTQGQYAASANAAKLTVTVALPPGVIAGVPTSSETVPAAGKKISLTVMAGSKPCGGSIGVSPGLPASLSLDTQGATTYTVPAASAGQTGPQTVTFTYSGGPTCAAAPQPVVYSYSYAP
jgi:hypothetical protein